MSLIAFHILRTAAVAGTGWVAGRVQQYVNDHPAPESADGRDGTPKSGADAVDALRREARKAGYVTVTRLTDALREYNERKSGGAGRAS